MNDPLTTQMILKRSIERTLDNFKKLGKANFTAAKIRSRLSTLKENWNQFRAGHAFLLSTTPIKERSSMEYFREEYFEATEDIFTTTLDYLTECLEEVEPCVSAHSSFSQSIVRSDGQSISNSHMPKIQLLPFDGKYSDWETFRDRFSALVVNNSSLSDFARLHYLVSSVKGCALDSIRDIALTADNFQLAWQTLHSRFENKRRLIATQFSAILGAATLSKESASDLQSLCDKYNIAIASLKNLGRTSSDLWDDLLVHTLTQKIDAASRKAWNLKTSDSDSPPSYAELNRFLTSRIRALDDCGFQSPSKSANSPTSRVHVATASSTNLPACSLCQARHYLSACSKFTGQSPIQRREIVKKLKRCFNCLSSSHVAPDCKSQYSCRLCKKRHHTTLHLDSDSDLTAVKSAHSAVASDSPSPASEVTSLFASTTKRPRAHVLLATAQVRLGVSSGRSIIARALIDQGSEVTFISESVAQALWAKRIRMPVSISAVGGAQVGTVRQATKITLAPINSDLTPLTTTALILPSLTAYAPKRTCDLSAFSHLSNLNLADSDPTSSAPIQILIGADLYSAIIREGIKRGKDDQPIAQNSVFGWILSGPLPPSAQPAHAIAHVSVHHCTSLQTLSDDIARFWESEECSTPSMLTPLEEQCETHFCTTHSRDSNGQYIVRLPFATPPPLDIGHSKMRAERLLSSIVRRLDSQPDLKTEYHTFMREYENLGHMRRVVDTPAPAQQCVYIPHHPVFRADSATTRVRVVFNASSVTSNGKSLNDHLLAGPKLQTELPAVILRWRQFQFVYTADIAKMYRQIRIDPRDLDYQRVLWYANDSTRISAYQLLTVTYGMTCAPFLALRVLRRLAEDEGHRFPLAAPILHLHTYVDDVLFGAHEKSTLRQLREQLVALLQRGHFELRKWASNSTDLLSDIDSSDHGLACSKSLSVDEHVKVLGISWSPAHDVFQFNVTLRDPIPISKREVLSTIARLYDPLGWVTPVTVATKIFLQHLWREKLDWDSRLPETLLSRWQRIYENLEHLNHVKIDRWINIQPNCQIELHGFADASTLAYAASVYLRVKSPAHHVSVSLLMSKSKVAPLTPLTVPRLELSAAVLLSRLVTFIQGTLGFAAVPCTCWTDSTIVLTWIRSHPSRWKTFVANRVHKIQTELPNATWRHVPTASNPADCSSRGLHGNELRDHPLWWHGPSWLKFPPAEWPTEPRSDNTEAPRGEEKTLSSHLCRKSDEPVDFIARYSSWPKLIHVTAYIFKFINACRRRPADTESSLSHTTTLSVRDCSIAKVYLIKRAQNDLFSLERQALQSDRAVAPKSSIAALTPFLDDDGIIRVGGRLRNSPFAFANRHPVILADHPLSRLIIAQTHIRTLHGGLQLTLSTLRQEYWVLRARNLAKTIIHRCIVCVRERATIPTQLMGNLPAVRVSKPARSFSHCGVDYAGPIKIRTSGGRGIASRKAYIALFVCLSTRAIHLELVGDYSSAAFLGAFTRFCSRRGSPASMYSDNGTTFVGADRELTAAYRSALRDSNFLNCTATDNISWHFIPPSAPHFGGMWEAGVRSVKHHLRRVIGDKTLTFEEFCTVLCQIEACLNSRPLAPISDSPDDYQCLTPGHFLIGSAISAPPESSVLNLNENRLSRWQLVRHVTERFWKLWSAEYINTLQQRNKWRKVEPPITVGRLVLLRNSTLPPCKWELGRVVRTHPGSDGLTRVVTVKTATSEYTRPIGRLCVLPVESASRTT